MENVPKEIIQKEIIDKNDLSIQDLRNLRLVNKKFATLITKDSIAKKLSMRMDKILDLNYTYDSMKLRKIMEKIFDTLVEETIYSDAFTQYFPKTTIFKILDDIRKVYVYYVSPYMDATFNEEFDEFLEDPDHLNHFDVKYVLETILHDIVMFPNETFLKYDVNGYEFFNRIQYEFERIYKKKDQNFLKRLTLDELWMLYEFMKHEPTVAWYKRSIPYDDESYGDDERPIQYDDDQYISYGEYYS